MILAAPAVEFQHHHQRPTHPHNHLSSNIRRGCKSASEQNLFQHVLSRRGLSHWTPAPSTDQQDGHLTRTCHPIRCLGTCFPASCSHACMASLPVTSPTHCCENDHACFAPLSDCGYQACKWAALRHSHVWTGDTLDSYQGFSNWVSECVCLTLGTGLLAEKS